ncbi:MAG: helix-hairpin-helix domain-containing protein [Syntrophobacteraceae bacterium]|nr:helix-hairpin-helix domain-containing protein [Syntrophobacteraceae bacterium]
MLKPSLPRGPWAGVTLVAALLLVLAVVRSQCRNPLPRPGPSLVVFELAGDIANPGIYSADGPRVTLLDALRMGGGLKGGDLWEIPPEHQSTEIRNGRKIHVSRSSSHAWTVRLELMNARTCLILGNKLDLNRASEEELALIPGMHPEFASAIVRRRAREPWRGIEELQEIPGVGPKTVQRWRDYLAVTDGS